jgi:uncharacterized membrane protein
MGLLRSAWTWLFPAAPPSATAGAGRSLVLDRAAILMPAIEWTFFGSLHFFLVQATVDEMPKWVPWPEAVAIVSGAVEVTIGLLILIPALRRAMAALSLATLVLLVPAMVVILTDPRAVPTTMNPVLRNAFIWGLAPNNIVLALLALYLVRHYDARLFPAAAAEAAA